MANDGMPGFQIPPEMRAFAEQSFDQAKKAFDGFVSATQQAMSSFEGRAATAQAGAKDVQQKAIAYSERNVAASFAFAQRLLNAKDAQEVMRLHADYVKDQIAILSEQSRDLAQAASQQSDRQAKS